MKNPYIQYGICLAATILIAMGLEYQLDFWNWQWSPRMFWRVWIVNHRIILLLLALGACLGTLQLTAVKSRAGRVLVFVYLTISIGYVGFYYIQEDRVPSVSDTFVAFDGLKDMFAIGKTAFQAYPYPIVLSLAGAMVVTAGLMLAGKRVRAMPKKVVPAWVAYAFYLTAIGFFCTYPEREYQIPVYIRTPTLVINGLKASFSIYTGTRAEPAIEPKNAASFRSHILYIMDESVVAKYLSLNGYELDTTPYLRTLSDPRFYNYGVASAAGNLSALSNIILVSGLRPDQIPDREQAGMRQASIFGYAKKSGRKTFYLDGQNTKPMNYLYTRDLRDFEYRKFFSSRLEYASTELYRIDFELLKSIEELIKTSTEPLFIFLLRSSCHFVYTNKYPPSAKYPELDSAAKEYRPYFYALRWEVDEFMKETARRLGDTDTVIVYTSDHGENISYLTEKFSLAHGNRDNPSSIEANVPIIIWPMSDRANDDFVRAGGFNAENFNRASHFQLFSTVLTLMGYNRDEAERLYGGSLFGPPPASRGFVSGNFLDFGRTEGAQRLNPFTIQGQLNPPKNGAPDLPE